MTVTVLRTDDAVDTWTDAGTRDLFDLVALVPSGPLAMSRDFEGLVETSTSVGEAATAGNALTLHHVSRSSNSSALPEVLAALDSAARLARGSFEIQQNDPGWRPNLESAALAATRRAYERLFGEPPIVTAVHAWLETAVIGERVPGLDMVSFGRSSKRPIRRTSG